MSVTKKYIKAEMDYIDRQIERAEVEVEDAEKTIMNKTQQIDRLKATKKELMADLETLGG